MSRSRIVNINHQGEATPARGGDGKMLESHQVEELICLVATLDKPTLTEQFGAFRGHFPVDFPPEFLHALPLERMRHIFVALCLQAQRLPTADMVTTAA